jgi:phytoene dehydrogenase-like protein
MPNADVIIIGAGLAGLSCALELVAQGHTPLLLEAADQPGGRVHTDAHEGFRFDRGFQVLQTAYPEARRLLDYPALDLRPFHPGALIRYAGRFHRIGDPWRHLSDALPTLLAPIGTLTDKLRIARLRYRVGQGSWESVYTRPETTTLQALRELGFSAAMINRFLRPFLAGVFFDDRLAMSSRAFEFVMRAFATGDTALPAAGMGAITDQLASRLPPNTLRLAAPVARLEQQTVNLATGERLTAHAVVVATDPWEAARLLGAATPPDTRSTTCLYFAAPEPPVRKPLLVLNGEGTGPINSLLVPSVVSPAYAPPGDALVTVNLLGNPAEDDKTLEGRVRTQLSNWFGTIIRHWRLLRLYRIDRALPTQEPPVAGPDAWPCQLAPWLFVCGEYQGAPAIQWALFTGRRAGVAVAAALRSGCHLSSAQDETG